MGTHVKNLSDTKLGSHKVRSDSSGNTLHTVYARFKEKWLTYESMFSSSQYNEHFKPDNSWFDMMFIFFSTVYDKPYWSHDIKVTGERGDVY